MIDTCTSFVGTPLYMAPGRYRLVGVGLEGDLGSSRLMIDTSTSFVGTPLYMAPGT
jgi:serine/threonine protein kinase